MQGDGPEADAVRNKKFKLIPRIVKGSWIVKQSVGTTPVLLGQKLATRYFRGPNYFEVGRQLASLAAWAGIHPEGAQEGSWPCAQLGRLRTSPLPGLLGVGVQRRARP